MPQTDKAKCWAIVVIMVIVFHFIVFLIKASLMGVFSGLSDLVAAIVLIVAVIRYDFCLAMAYIVICLFEVFSLVIVLGYYLQTDMGKNAPSPAEGVEEENSGKKGKASKSGVHILLRGLFDKILRLKYSFYQNWSDPFGTTKSKSTILAEVERSDKDDRLAKTHGPIFIISFCCALILFYVVATLLVHYAYREWKGLAEDCAGGSINGTDGKNFLHYAVILKREDDAIEEAKEIEEKKRAYAAKRARQNGDDAAQPLMGDDQPPNNNNENNV